MLYWTCAWLTFIGGLCSTEHIGSVLVSKDRGEVLGNTAVLGIRSGHYANIWIDDSIDILLHHLHVVCITPLSSFECMPNQTT